MVDITRVVIGLSSPFLSPSKIPALYCPPGTGNGYIEKGHIFQLDVATSNFCEHIFSQKERMRSTKGGLRYIYEKEVEN
jgi:hypothetical protein